MPLDPQAEAILKKLADSGAQPFETMTLAESQPELTAPGPSTVLQQTNDGSFSPHDLASVQLRYRSKGGQNLRGGVLMGIYWVVFDCHPKPPHALLEKVEQALPEGRSIEEVVADKGYHSTQRMVDLDAVGLRSYVSEPRRGKRRWRGDRQGQEAVYANRRRIRGERGQRLLRATRRAAGATLCASVRERRDETAACTGT